MFNSFQKSLISYLVFLVLYWIILHRSGLTDSVYNFLYSFLFSLIPLVIGFFGLFKSKIWGGLSSHVGKAIFFISLGIFVWGMGSMGWSYYNLVAHIEAPYPSWADLGFSTSIFFYGIGAIYLSKATGAKFGLRNSAAKIFVIIAPIIILLISYHVLINIARGGVLIPEGETLLKTILDIAYPLGDFVSLTVAIIVSGLSFKYLGGKYTKDIWAILSGLAIMYFADFVFSYTTTVGTFYNGNWGDLALTMGLFCIAFGVSGFFKLRDA